MEQARTSPRAHSDRGDVDRSGSCRSLARPATMPAAHAWIQRPTAAMISIQAVSDLTWKLPGKGKGGGRSSGRDRARGERSSVSGFSIERTHY